jgi:hypothetical protein
MIRFAFGVGLGVAATVVAVLVLQLIRSDTAPSRADRKRAADKVLAAASSLPSGCCKRIVHSACTSSFWSVCVVTVFVPEPLDACQDWSINVHDHFVTEPRWLQTYGGCLRNP